MILFFAGIVAGIIIGLMGSAFVFILREMREDMPAEGDLADFITDITPQKTPFMSEIERHRQKHLAARGGDFDGTGSGLHRRGTQWSDTGIPGTDTTG